MDISCEKHIENELEKKKLIENNLSLYNENDILFNIILIKLYEELHDKITKVKEQISKDGKRN